jgi:Protein of unknown function (DUF2924)
VGWRQLHRTEPPPGLSRDLIIRALAHQLQEGSYGEASRALRRRLQSLSAEFEKGAPCRDFRIGLKAGTTLVRQWRGHAYTVLVREDGFEHRPALPLFDRDRRADHRGALVGSAVLWPGQARASALVGAETCR